MQNEFDRLQKIWYKKLAAEGFEDIENSDGSLKATTDLRVIKRAFLDKQERETYHSIASEFLNTHQFSTPLEKRAWEMHVAGSGRLSIAKKLGLTYYKANILITNLQKLAKLRKSK